VVISNARLTGANLTGAILTQGIGGRVAISRQGQGSQDRREFSVSRFMTATITQARVTATWCGRRFDNYRRGGSNPAGQMVDSL
jgi:uncharacterized protein YjbI with pentapeptide repeats